MSYKTGVVLEAQQPSLRMFEMELNCCSVIQWYLWSIGTHALSISLFFLTLLCAAVVVQLLLAELVCGWSELAASGPTFVSLLFPPQEGVAVLYFYLFPFSQFSWHEVECDRENQLAPLSDFLPFVPIIAMITVNFGCGDANVCKLKDVPRLPSEFLIRLGLDALSVWERWMN